MVKKNTIKLLIIALICVGIFLVLISTLGMWLLFHTTNVVVVNDTPNKIELSICELAHDGPDISPNSQADINADVNSLHSACAVFTLKGSYIGCLLTPTTNPNNLTFKVSNVRKDIPEAKCGQ